MSEWIGVEDYLPEEGVTVLLCEGGEVLNSAFRLDSDDDGKFFASMTDNSAFDVSFFTHWMPLPEPPKN